MKTSHIVILIIFIIIISLNIVFYYFVSHYTSNLQANSQIGDAFGILNTFFSSIAFVSVIYTLFQQNEMIKQGQIDTDITINELNLSVKRYEKEQKISNNLNLTKLYEKRLSSYTNDPDNNSAIQLRAKINQLSTELEQLLN